MFGRSKKELLTEIARYKNELESLRPKPGPKTQRLVDAQVELDSYNKLAWGSRILPDSMLEQYRRAIKEHAIAHREWLNGTK